MHLDKSFYETGDTIWFKAYVTTADKHLSKSSGVLNVELINEKDSLISSLKLSITAGVYWGDFNFEESLRPGAYRVRAYTNWMRNAGEEYFFDTMIQVAGEKERTDAIDSRQNSLQKVKSKFDLQFFPEGGDLVNGISSKIAFKAVDQNGHGVMVEGIIIDNENRKVADLISQHLGMGSFILYPEKGKRYKANVIYPNGEKQFISLPEAKEKGFVLAINNDDYENLNIKITANAPLFSEVKNSEVILIAQSGGTVFYAAKSKLVNYLLVAQIPKSRFPSGEAGAQFYAIIRSVTDTCIKNGQNILDAFKTKSYLSGRIVTNKEIIVQAI